MTRKEQEQNKIKGFAPKWSKRLYTILRKTRLRKNEFVFRYDSRTRTTEDPWRKRGSRGPEPVRPRYKEVTIGGYEPEDDMFGDQEWEHE